MLRAKPRRFVRIFIDRNELLANQLLYASDHRIGGSSHPLLDFIQGREGIPLLFNK
ncbi:hypothetical protein D3C85_1449130 [compost metagenome]